MAENGNPVGVIARSVSFSAMGDLAVDTAVEALGDGRYRAVLSGEWEIWGPMGGYVAAFALRAAGAESRFNRPVSFFCHYLHVAAFEPIELQVSTLRSARTALSQRVTITQGERQVLEATVWSAGEVEGLEHDTPNHQACRHLTSCSPWRSWLPTANRPSDSGATSICAP